MIVLPSNCPVCLSQIKTVESVEAPTTMESLASTWSTKKLKNTSISFYFHFTIRMCEIIVDTAGMIEISSITVSYHALLFGIFQNMMPTIETVIKTVKR